MKISSLSHIKESHFRALILKWVATGSFKRVSLQALVGGTALPHLSFHEMPSGAEPGNSSSRRGYLLQSGLIKRATMMLLLLTHLRAQTGNTTTMERLSAAPGPALPERHGALQTSGIKARQNRSLLHGGGGKTQNKSYLCLHSKWVPLS